MVNYCGKHNHSTKIQLWATVDFILEIMWMIWLIKYTLEDYIMVCGVAWQ